MPTRKLMPTFLRLLLTLTLALVPLLPTAWAGTATRSLSATNYTASQEVTVSVELAPLASEAFNTLEEVVPPGWELVSAGTASWTSSTRTLRWVALGGLVRTLSYVVRAPSPASAAAVFSGQAAFDGAVVAVGGLGSLPVRPPGTASRSFPGNPGTYRPGTAVAVTVTVTPAADGVVHGAEETVPEGWNVASISHGGSISGRKVTWPLFTDGASRALSYSATPPPGASGSVSFSGTATFDGTAVGTGGASALNRAVEVQGTLARGMPATFRTGEALGVTLVATPGEGVLGYSVSEQVPAGWTARAASHAGTVSADGRSIQWGPFLDSDARTLSYEAMPGAGAGGTVAFVGHADFSGSVVTAGGATNTTWVSRENGTAVRGLPGTVRVGTEFEVTVTATPNEHVSLYTVQEVVPAGYAVSLPPGTAGAPQGTFLAASRTVTWGPISNEGAVTLRYRLTPGEGAATGPFAGTASFGPATAAVDGPTTVSVVPLLAGVATRTLPTVVTPGTVASVGLVATPDAGVGLYVVEEVLPTGWSPATLPAGATWDGTARRVRFGPFNDDAARALDYTVNVGSGSSGPATFSGTATFNGTGFEVGGVAVTLADAPPVITALPDQVVLEDELVRVAFVVTDDLTATADLTLWTTSSNPVLAPASLLTLGQTLGGTRFIGVGMTTNEHGSTTITLHANDGRQTTTRSFLLTAAPVNDLPVMAPVADRVIDELTPLSLTWSATDVDIPAQALTYALESGPSGMTVSASGALAWTPTEAQGPSTNTVRVSVTDGVDVVSQSFVVVVREVNAAPVLAAVANRSLDRMKKLALDLSATDADIPAQALTYSLESGPAGMTVSAAGRVEWTSSLAQGPGAYPVTVRASDGVESVTGSFTVDVVAINDAPTFARGADRVEWDDAGGVVVPGWASGMSAGPADESGQALGFVVETTNAGLFAVTPAISADGTLTYTPREMARGVATVTVRLKDDGGTANGGADTSAAQVFTITVEARPRVVGRWLFYNNSRFDGNNAGLGVADDGAIASNKTALRPGGGASSFANVSSYSRGINGVMVDMVGLAGTPTASDFGFRVGRVADLSQWTAGAAPVAVAMRAGAGVGGSDRVTLRWSDSTVRNQWLEVTVKAGGQTGLAVPDVFYFGSVVGEVGDTAAQSVTVGDVLSVRLAARFGLVPLTAAQDMNRDGLVNTTDVLLVRVNQTTTANRVSVIAP